MLNPNPNTDYLKENDLKQVPKIEEFGKIDIKENPPGFSQKEKMDEFKEEPIIRSEPEKAKLGYTNPTAKSILKIVEFYSDNTFREFYPE